MPPWPRKRFCPRVRTATPTASECSAVCLVRLFGCQLWRSNRRGTAGRNYHDADQHQQGSQNCSQVERFAAKEIANEYGDNRVHIGVGADLGGRFPMNQPEIGGVT